MTRLIEFLHHIILPSSSKFCTMTSKQLDIIAPLDSPLPPPSNGDVLTEAQWETLMAIADTVIPSIEVTSTSSSNQNSIQTHEYAAVNEKLNKASAVNSDSGLSRKYLEENPSSLPGFKQSLKRTLGEYIRPDALKGIRVILSTLEWGAVWQCNKPR